MKSSVLCCLVALIALEWVEISRSFAFTGNSFGSFSIKGWLMKQPQTNASNHRRVRSEPSISFDQTDSSISPPLSDLTINSTTSSTPSAASSGTTNVSTLESEDEALAHYADTLLTQLDVQLARAQERIKRKGSFATDAKLANLQAMRRQLDERQKFVRSYRSNDSWWSTAQLRTTVLVAKTLLEALRFVPNKL